MFKIVCMNIFVLSLDPVQAAKDLCNKHISKMCIETAQLLCTAHSPDVTPYKHTHYNHPCAIWTRNSLSNYQWLVEHGLAISSEFEKRYCKQHKSQLVIEWAAANKPNMPDKGLTQFAVAIANKEWHVKNDVVSSYRCYYIAEKSAFARWAPRAIKPVWWPFDEGETI